MRVRLLAPTGSDAKVACEVLENAGFSVAAFEDMDGLCSNIDDAGVLLIAEEALGEEARNVLFAALDNQPKWSDIPLVVLTSEGELSRTLPREIAELTYRANLTLLERPVRVATLMTMISSALRARKRQFDLRQVIEEVREAREEADHANQAKSQFLTTMSHELRTPLNAIAGYTEILLLGIPGSLNEQQKQHLQSIAKSEQHLLMLINDVLDFAKIEAGHLKFEYTTFDAAETVADLETFVTPQIAHKSIHYSAQMVPGVKVFADEEKTRQILLNLLSNAIKFTPEGGKIDVSIAPEDGVVLFTVSDNGSGIAAEKLESVFEPFVQVGRAFNAPGLGGTGLGLSISRDLARRMGGDLTVKSKLGKGSSFILSLPLKR